MKFSNIDTDQRWLRWVGGRSSAKWKAPGRHLWLDVFGPWGRDEAEFIRYCNVPRRFICITNYNTCLETIIRWDHSDSVGSRKREYRLLLPRVSTSHKPVSVRVKHRRLYIVINLECERQVSRNEMGPNGSTGTKERDGTERNRK